MAITGGDKLRKKLEQLKRGAKELRKLEAQVGVFEHQQYEDGTPVAHVAAIHEWGAPEAGIPARPFLRPAVTKHTDEWADKLADKVSDVMDGKMTAKQAWEIVADGAMGDIKQSIADVNTPALKAATVKRKGFDKPLVDSALLLQSINQRIIDKE